MAGHIPRDFIEDLLARIDIVDVIDDCVPLRKAGKNHQACCPFHEEKTPSFTVSQDKQFYHCFGCHANGTVISFLMEYRNMRFPEAVAELASRCGLSVPQAAGYTPAINAHAELHELLELIIQHYKRQLREHGKQAVDYLKQRGISGEIAAAYELGYAPPGWDKLLQQFAPSKAAAQRLAQAGMIIARDDGSYYDRFRDRIMYPIRDQRGRAIGFGGRIMGEATPKYINSPETPVFHKGKELYGLHQARQKDKHLRCLYIVEGYMDVIALAQYGIHNAVATLGTAVSSDHIARLFRNTGQIIFCFDGDEAGRQAAWRAMETTLAHLRDGREARFKFMPPGDDPDSYVRTYGAETFLNPADAVPLSDFLLDGLTSSTDPGSREGRARLLHELLPFINKLPRSGLKDMLIQDVATLCRLQRQHIEDRLAGLPVDKPQHTTRTAKTRAPAGDGRGLLGNIVCYILIKPELAKYVDEVEALRAVPVAGVNFLIELLELVHQRPDIPCAAIIEHWRGTPYEARLHQLISSSDILDEDGFDLERQFLDAMDRLREKQRQQELAICAEKNPSEMSEADKDALRKRISALKLS